MPTPTLTCDRLTGPRTICGQPAVITLSARSNDTWTTPITACKDHAIDAAKLDAEIIAQKAIDNEAYPSFQAILIERITR